MLKSAPLRRGVYFWRNKMQKVSVKFNCAEKWAVSITEQIQFVKDQVVDNLPLSFATMMVEKGKGEIVGREDVNSAGLTKDEDDELEQRYIDKETSENNLVYSELYSMKIDRIKVIAECLEIESTTKSKTIDKILNSQHYEKDFLNSIDGKDVVAICKAKGLDFEDKESAELIDKILETQNEKG